MLLIRHYIYFIHEFFSRATKRPFSEVLFEIAQDKTDTWKLCISPQYQIVRNTIALVGYLFRKRLRRIEFLALIMPRSVMRVETGHLLAGHRS